MVAENNIKFSQALIYIVKTILTVGSHGCDSSRLLRMDNVRTIDRGCTTFRLLSSKLEIGLEVIPDDDGGVPFW